MTVILAAAPGDAPRLAALHAACFSDGWNAAAIAALFGSGFRAEVNGADAGFILARAAGGEAEILTVAVLPPYRRAGIGARLLSHALDAMRDAGAGEIFLEVDHTNVAAQGLYRAAGFAPVGRRPGYYGATDAIVLRRMLSPLGGAGACG